MQSVILVTGAGTGIGQLTSRTLAHVGHIVYASMREIGGRNATRAATERAYAEANELELNVLELNVSSQASAHAAVQRILDEQLRLDVVVHNAGHLAVGVCEAFTDEQVRQIFDTNALGAHRVNRAVLPAMRKSGCGLLLYVGSTTSRMIYPFMGPYEAAKSALDVMAQATRYEVSTFGIDVVIVMPGAFTQGTEHFPNAMHPADREVGAGYEGVNSLAASLQSRLAGLVPEDADPQSVADEITRVIAMPAGKRPFRPMVDFLQDGAAEVNAAADTAQARLMQRLGISALAGVGTRGA